MVFILSMSDKMNLDFKKTTENFTIPIVERDAEIREVFHFRKVKIDKVVSL